MILFKWLISKLTFGLAFPGAIAPWSDEWFGEE
jgi:hypothetical protein